MRDQDQISGVVADADSAVASKRIAAHAIGRSKRIGFLFNHDQIHQIAHSLPIALALAAQDGPFEVIIASTSAKLRQEIERLAGSLIGRITLVDLAMTSPVSRSLVTMFGKILPAHKILIYRDNLEFFRLSARVSVPPCARATAETMDSPSPLPGVVRLSSSRDKRERARS